LVDVFAVCFDLYDEDQSGSISREELTKVLVHHRRRSRAQNQLPPHVLHQALKEHESGVAAAGGATSAPRPDHISGTTSPLLGLNSPRESSVDMSLGGNEDADLHTVEKVGVDSFAMRFVEMDPDAYEIAEGIAQLFDSIDQNRDNQISLEEFLEGAKRHPELLGLFFNKDEPLPPPPAQGAVQPPPVPMAVGDSLVMDTNP